MAKAKQATEAASQAPMVGMEVVSGFWDAVRACLVKFHHLSQIEADRKVDELWARLARLESGKAEMPREDDLIYHEQPWYIACNLVNCDKPLAPHRTAYKQILEQNHLV
jgi:hypothetical protein